MAKFLPNVFISGVHGKRYDVLWNGKNIVVVPMYHPAASLRNGNVLAMEKLDFVALKDILAEISKQKSSIVEAEQVKLV